MMTLRRVLVTRPQPGADRTADGLRALGYQPVVLPLTQAVPLAHAVSAVVPNLVLATSPQAFRHLGPGMAAALSTIPLRVTGKATAQSARKAGFSDVTESGGDVSGLISVLRALPLGALRILYLAGRVRRPELELFLKDMGASLAVTEVYDTVSVSHSTEKLRSLLTGGAISAALLTSVNCAHLLAEATRQVKYDQALENTVLICLSPRIAEAAKTLFPNPIRTAVAPTEDALLSCLQTALAAP